MTENSLAKRMYMGGCAANCKQFGKPLTQVINFVSLLSGYVLTCKAVESVAE